MIDKCSRKNHIVRYSPSLTQRKMPKISTSITNTIDNIINDINKTLIISYSPTGGGHTVRTLSVVEHALTKGTLTAGDLVFFHIPPHWENMPRPDLLKSLANKLVEKNITVKFAESDKPIYGYLDERTGSSNDTETLRRMALHPLRDKKNAQIQPIIDKYFISKPKIKYQNIVNYHCGAPLDELPKIGHADLMEGIIKTTNINKIFILSDMEPGLQKSAANYSIPTENRVDQQNHSIILKEKSKNLNFSNALLAKILDARGGKISHISLGEKNTLFEAYKTALSLNIHVNTVLNERRKIIYNVILSAIKNIIPSSLITLHGGILKGKHITNANDIDKVIYIYAHKKNNIILKHITEQLEKQTSCYHNNIFIFCGKEAIPGYNALHLAYLIDADGITTAGAGTAGEFSYLHRKGKSTSSLLILPIENHNEQEAIATRLHEEFPKYILRLQRGETLSGTNKLYQLITRAPCETLAPTLITDPLIMAISHFESYAEQTHDILFGLIKMDKTMQEFHNIQRGMYHNKDMKATRHYLKLFFQLTTHFIMEKLTFPIEIYFKQTSSPAITFNNPQEVRDIFIDKTTMMNLIKISNIHRIEQLPLFNDVSDMMRVKHYPPARGKIIKMSQRLGRYMTTGF